MSETYNISYSRLELPRRIFYLSVSKKGGETTNIRYVREEVGSVENRKSGSPNVNVVLGTRIFRRFLKKLRLVSGWTIRRTFRSFSHFRLCAVNFR